MLRSISMMKDLCLRYNKSGEGTSWGVDLLSIIQDLQPSQQSDRVLFVFMKMREAVEHFDPSGISSWLLKLTHELQGATYNKNVENWLSDMALLEDLHSSWPRHQMICYQDPVADDAMLQDLGERQMYADGEPTTRAAFEELLARMLITKQSNQKNDHNTTSKKRELEYGKLLRVLCNSPAPKSPRNVSWLKKATEARQNVSKYWQFVREAIADPRSETGLPNFAIDTLMSFDISPGYIAEVAAEREEIEDEDARKKMREAQAQSEMQFVRQPWDIGAGEDLATKKGLPKQSESPVSIEDSVQKLALDQAPENDVAPVATATTLTPRFPVKQDTLSIMAKAFSIQADGTKEVPWIEFVRALMDIGMNAAQGPGSAVVFSNHLGSLSFNKPHPKPVVSAIKLRGFGKRLHKWFGWDNDSFVLRQRESSEVREDGLG
jgi:hypothetical protein